MGSQRLTRVNELLLREIGSSLYRVIDVDGFDHAAVTVTRVDTSSNLRNARVMVSVRGDDAERKRLLAVLKARRIDIQNEVFRHVVLKYTPRLSFALDASIQEGHRVMELLDGLGDSEDWTDDNAEPPSPATTS